MIVSRFGGRAIAAVVVSLGLAAFDLGPRASAALWTTLSGPDHAAVGGAAAPANPYDPAPRVWPPAHAPREILDVLGPLPNGSGTGGAGSPSPTATGGANAPALGSAAGISPAPPDFSSFLRARLTFLLPTP